MYELRYCGEKNCFLLLSEKMNIMKKILLTLGSIFLWEIGYAQIPVTDAAANGQLGIINKQLIALNKIIAATKKTGYMNKVENYKQRILGENNLDFIHKVEDYMWQADEYLKKGQEIKMIYDKEEDILKKLNQLKRSTSRYGNLDGSTYSAFTSSIRGTLSKVGGMVDNAQAILGDENTRMSTEGRREILKETLAELVAIEASLDNIITKNKLVTIAEEDKDNYNQYWDNVDYQTEKFLRDSKNKKK